MTHRKHSKELALVAFTGQNERLHQWTHIHVSCRGMLYSH